MAARGAKAEPAEPAALAMPDGIVDVVYDYDLIKRRISREGLRENRDYSIWRYKPLLPVEPDAAVPPLQVG